MVFFNDYYLDRTNKDYLEKGDKMDTIYLAKWESRFWAWLIDIILVGIVSNFLSNYLGFLGNYGLMSPFFLANVKSFGVNGILLFAYWTILEGYSGQSIGKMALNLKTADRKGGKIDFGIAALESFGKAFILPLDCLIGWLAMPNSKLRLFNRISNTIVMRTKYEAPDDVKYVKEKE